MSYIPLHVHDEDASVGDSILNLKDYVKKGVEFGLPALAITNHGSIASMYKFYKLCEDNHIKPIIGNEMYVVSDKDSDLVNYSSLDAKGRKKIKYTPGEYSHLVLIAQNKEGFKNLLHLTSYSAIKTFYKRPLITEEQLFSHSEGLICLTACVGGLFPKMINEKQDPSVIKEKLKEYTNVFKDRFYLELQPCNFPEQIKTNMHLARYAKELNLPVVATNDVHYLNREDAVVHNIHVADYRKQVVGVDDELIYKDDCFYFMEEKDLQLLGVDEAIQKEAILNTERIANSCEHIELIKDVQMPIFDKNLSPTESLNMLYDLAFEKLNRIIHTVDNPYIYSERLLYELGVIEKLGFVDYFLIIWDLFRYAKEANIMMGPGRGSVCGSLLAYCLNITKVDPVKYDLLFERFLSEFRIGSIPDIDVDSQSSKRDMLFKYVQDKYGYDHCAQVSTKSIRKAKSAIKDAARALNIENYIEVGQKIANLIPTVYYDDAGEKETDLDIERALEINEELRNYEAQYPELFKIAIGLQNKPKSDSIHAAGILIFPKKLQEYLPLRLSKNETLPATSLNLKDAENVAIKFDFLALRTLDMVDNIQKTTGFIFDFENSAIYQDTAAWNVLGSQYNSGIFQVSSYTYKKRMSRLAPKTIDELAACLALVRGPCISTGLDEVYMQIVEGKQKVKLIHPIYDEATKDSLGIMIYQEQSMKMFQNAGMSSEDSFKLMKLMSKKNASEEKLRSYKETFYSCCTQKGAEIQTIDYMWHLVEESAKYSFNKSHALAYALLCYCTAYYKAHYSKQFFTALTTHEFESNAKPEDKKQTLNNMLREIREYGYKVIIPEINLCKEYSIDIIGTNKIMLGTCAIKGFGSALNSMKLYGTIKEIKDLFGERPAYGTLKTKKACEEIWRDIPVAPKSSVIAGIFAGLFDSVYNSKKTRKEIYEEYMALRKLYCAGTTKEVADEKISISKQLILKSTQSNKTLEKALYSVSI